MCGSDSGPESPGSRDAKSKSAPGSFDTGWNVRSSPQVMKFAEVIAEFIARDDLRVFVTTQAARTGMWSSAPSVLELAEKQSAAGEMKSATGAMQSPVREVQSPVGEMQSAAGRREQGSSPVGGDGGGDGGKGGSDGGGGSGGDCGGGCGGGCRSDDSLGSVSPPSTATDEESTISDRGIIPNYV